MTIQWFFFTIIIIIIIIVVIIIIIMGVQTSGCPEWKIKALAEGQTLTSRSID